MPRKKSNMDHLLAKGSQARLSELLSIMIQAGKAIRDEYDGIMGPDGEGWDHLLQNMVQGPDKPESTKLPDGDAVIANAGPSFPPTTKNAPTHAHTSTLVPPTSNRTLLPSVQNGTRVKPPLASPADAAPKDLSVEQRTTEWRLINHYADVRAKMTRDQLANAHAAFLRWWGWAPSMEEMQRAREAAKAIWTLTTEFGPWCSPFGTQVWLKASRDQSIAKIKKLKKSDWNTADTLACVVGVKLDPADKPTNSATAEKSSTQVANANSLIVKLRTDLGTVKPDKKNENSSAHPLDQSEPSAAETTNRLVHADRAASSDTAGDSSNGRGWMHWIADRAGSLGRSLISNPSQDQLPHNSVQIQSVSQPTLPVLETLISGPDQPSEGISNGDTHNLKNDIGQEQNQAIHKEQELHEDQEKYVGMDPSYQLHQEMLMHTPCEHQTSLEGVGSELYREEGTEMDKQTGIKQEDREDEQLISYSTAAQQQTSSNTGSSNTIDVISELTVQTPNDEKVVQPFYNYAADATDDPRINALIAYIIVLWRSKHKQNLSQNAEALHRLANHCAHAMGSIIERTAQGLFTYGLFRWDNEFLTWELRLEHIDSFVKMRARQKDEQENGRDQSRIMTDKGEATAAEVSSSFLTDNQADTSALNRNALRPRVKRSEYPDSSIVAISELTPDARANAFAAYLAKKFYRYHSIDLMENEESKHRLLLHATKNESRVRGVKSLKNYEMNFWKWMDLKWELTGHQLDVMRDEWVKRFPEPEESDNADVEMTDSNDADDEDEDNSKEIKKETTLDSSSTICGSETGQPDSLLSDRSTSSAGSKRRWSERSVVHDSDDEDTEALTDIAGRQLKRMRRSISYTAGRPAYSKSISPKTHLHTRSSISRSPQPAPQEPKMAAMRDDNDTQFDTSNAKGLLESDNLDQNLLNLAEEILAEE